MHAQPCVPALDAHTQRPNAQIHHLCDGDRTAAHSVRDEHQLPALAQAPGDLRSERPDPLACAVNGHDCFRLVGEPAGSLSKTARSLISEEDAIKALVDHGWFWYEPGKLARPWNKRVKCFMNPEGL